MFEKVQAIIAEQLNLDKEKITMESRLTEDLGADSLDAVEIIMQLEDEFNVQIDDSTLQETKTVGDIVNSLEKTIK